MNSALSCFGIPIWSLKQLLIHIFNFKNGGAAPKIIVAPISHKKQKTMRKNIIIAAVAAIAAFAANTEFANAQSTVANRLAEKAKAYYKSEGPKTLAQDVTSLASQKTYFYGNERFEGSIPVIREDSRRDSLIISLMKAIRRDAISGAAGGFQIGGMMLAENFTGYAGITGTMTWKRIEVMPSFGLAVSKFNSESSKPGKAFISPIGALDLGVVLYRGSMNGYDNQWYISAGGSFKYILDKNINQSGETTYETDTEYITTSDYFSVKGNSMCFSGYIKARFSLKHMGTTSAFIKAEVGAFNRYYEEGSRKKMFAGLTGGIEFSGAKKRTDADVVELQKSLEQGDYTLINEVVNQLRSNMK